MQKISNTTALTHDLGHTRASKRVMIRFLAAASLSLLTLAPGAQARPVSRVLVRTGVITPKSTRQEFSFRARRGQKITAEVRSKTRGFAPLLFITSPSGRNLTQDKNTSYSARLSETGLYRARVGVNFMATNALRGVYRLEIRVR